MGELSQRLAALDPEKRLLLQLLREEKKRAAGAFSLLSPQDREKLPEGVEDAFPLSMVQAGMLGHMELLPGAVAPPAYHNVNSWHVRARLDAELLGQAIRQVVARHALLRTGFDLTSYSEPLQLVYREVHLPLEIEDLRGLPPAERDRSIEQFILLRNRQLLDLTRPPLVRYYVHRRTDETFQFTLVEPHSISDGWSTHSNLNEIFLRYRALLAGQPLAEEPPPAVAFRDFVGLERQALGSAETREFWMRQIHDAPATRLPRWPAPFRGAPEAQEHKLFYAFPPDLVEALHRTAREMGVPLKSLLFAAHLKVIGITCGETSLLTGLVFNGRPEESGGTDVRGLFLNTLPFRIELGSESWAGLARRVFEIETEMLPHRRYPLSALQKTAGREALFEIAFGYLHFHALNPLLGTGEIELMPYGHSDLSKTHFPLMVVCELNPRFSSQMRLILEYGLDAFCEEQMRAFYDRYLAVLSHLVTHPGERHDRWEPPTAREQRQLRGWQGADVAHPVDASVHGLVAARAAQAPGAVAVIAGENRMSQAEVEKESNRLARYLRERGVGPETRVGICLERRPELIVALLAVLKAGGAYVPLDPGLPQERLDFILGDSAARVLVTREGLAARFLTRPVETVRIDADRPAIAAHSAEAAGGEVWPDGAAYVLYTSGSTGAPKGVTVTHRGLINYLLWSLPEYGAGPESRVPVHSSFGFDLTVTSLLLPLLAGGAVVLVPEDSGGESLVRVLEEGAATGPLKITPAHLEVLRQQLSPQAAARVGTLIVGGEALSAEAVRSWARLAPATRIINEYGPTEAVVGCCVQEISGELASDPVPIGRPIANTRLWLLDASWQPVPVGTPGELCVAGPGVARGYHGRPALTAAKFVPDFLSEIPGGRLYHTGDLARRLPDGTLEFLGRIDRQLKVHGYRIEAGEIESVLRQHAQVREAVVVLREDRPGDRQLVAYVVAAGEEPTAGALRAHLEMKLPDYMIPPVFCLLAALPLTPNGKIDRRALPTPEAARPEIEASFVAPRTPEEEALSRIWAEILGLERVGVHENFFELGGDSIRALLLVSRSRKQGIRLTSALLFQHPTVEALARAADFSGAAVTPLPEREPADGPVHPTPIQQWFFDQDLPDPHHFNQAVLLEVHLRLDPARLERALRLLVEHHDALRLRFVLGESGWQAHVSSEQSGPFTWIDFSGLPPAGLPGEVSAQARALQRSLDLARRPIVRAAFFDLGPGRAGRLLILAHHLVVDGVSWRVLLEDLQNVYQQMTRGERPSLPPKTLSYRGWAELLRAEAASETMGRELDHWLSLPWSRGGRLPVDRPDGENTVREARTVSVLFDRNETGMLLHQMPRIADAQIHEALLAALVQALSRWTGSGAWLVDLEGHGREEIREGVDVSRTVGWFTTLFPVFLDLAGDPGPAEALARVRSQLRSVPRRGIGYGLLRYLSPRSEVREALRSLPRPEVSFNYLGQFDEVFSGPFIPASESFEPVRSPRGRRSHLLEVTALIGQQQLRVDWTYSGAHHNRSTIERLAEAHAEALRALLDHHGSPESERSSETAPGLAIERDQLERALDGVEFEV